MKMSYGNQLLVLFGVLCCISLLVVIQAANANYDPTDKIFLNCGAKTETTDGDGRKWSTDIGSKFTPAEDNSLTGNALVQDPSVPQVPYMTARIFRSHFTYSFSVASGWKFLRLYFYSSSYAGLNASDALFGVTCGKFTLLRNFSASQTTEALNFAFIVKEFVVYVVDGTLNVTFQPSSNANAYAFVNGIEVVSMPDIYNSEDEKDCLVGQSQTAPFIIGNSTFLENVYRFNVGGKDIKPTDDTGMYRSWADDSPYIYGASTGVTDSTNLTIRYPDGMPSYIAPTDVYATARTMGPNSDVNLQFYLTWYFPVDTGFFYLLRLHFCEIQPAITMTSQRMFQIFINNQTAAEAADIVSWAGGNGIPVYKDFVVVVPLGNGQQDLRLALHPTEYTRYAQSEYYDSILNGVEIFKVNDTEGNLAGPNPIPAPRQDRIDPSSANQSSRGNSKNKTGVIAGGVVSGLLLCFFGFVSVI